VIGHGARRLVERDDLGCIALEEVSVSERTFAFATWFFPCFETYAAMAHDPEPAPEMVPVI
jgi:hypothetical protein